MVVVEGRFGDKQGGVEQEERVLVEMIQMPRYGQSLDVVWVERHIVRGYSMS